MAGGFFDKLFTSGTKRKGDRTRQQIAAIQAYYRVHPTDDPEIGRALDYLARKSFRSLPPFPDPFCETPWEGSIGRDSAFGLCYVVQEGRKLYFGPVGGRKLRNRYTGLYREQLPESPHCYLSETFDMPQGTVLFDIGSAEGCFSLAMIDRASRVFLFEANKKWIPRLEKTFAPWKDRVDIIHTYVSDTDSSGMVTIDSVTDSLPDGTSLFLKIDVEGAERQVLAGAERTFASGRFDVHVALCTYHRPEACGELSALMRAKGFRIETSRGYMLFPKGGFDPPYFRRAMIRCTKGIGR